MKSLVLFLLLIYIGADGSYSVPFPNAITIEGDVLTGLSLPPYGVLCEDTPVRGAPEGTQILYELSAGQTVPLREQPQFHHRDWVMIKAARWIPLESLCK